MGGKPDIIKIRQNSSFVSSNIWGFDRKLQDSEALHWTAAKFSPPQAHLPFNNFFM
jgi:hypothetical protein